MSDETFVRAEVPAFKKRPTAPRRTRSSALSEKAKQLPGVRRFYAWNHAPKIHALVLDGFNRVRYGPDAPRFAERLWIDPSSVQRYDRKGTIWKSARVLTGSWPTRTEKPLEADPILEASVAHWVHDVPWEETSEIDRMKRAIARLGEHGGCRTRADILNRCARLDTMFETIRREGRVRPQVETTPETFRELGGIGMHIGPGGTLIRAGNGRHRFAIARILKLPFIPVRIGWVHYSALPMLKGLRRSPGLPWDRP